MHELSVALSIIDVAEQEVLRLGATEVLAIHLKIGELSGVGKSHLKSAFELASENTLFAKTRLIFEDVPVIADCPACQQPRRVSSAQQLTCSICQSPISNIVQGRELQIAAMEVE